MENLHEGKQRPALLIAVPSFDFETAYTPQATHREDVDSPLAREIEAKDKQIEQTDKLGYLLGEIK